MARFSSSRSPLLPLAHADVHQAGKGVQRQRIAQHFEIPAPLGKQKTVARQVIGQNQIQLPGAEHVQQAAEFGLDNLRPFSPAVSKMAYLHAAPARADPDHAVLPGPHVAGPADIAGTRAKIGLGEIHEFPPPVSLTDPQQKVEPAVAHALEQSVQRQEDEFALAAHGAAQFLGHLQVKARGVTAPVHQGKRRIIAVQAHPQRGGPRRGRHAEEQQRQRKNARKAQQIRRSPHPFHGNPHPDNSDNLQCRTAGGAYISGI